MKKEASTKRKTFLPFMILLIAGFVISIGASFLFLKDKFSVDSSFLSQGEFMTDEKSAGHAEEPVSRLYKPSQRDLPVRGETVLRKDELLVLVEDFIRKRVEPYKVDLLDLYMDREGVVYIDVSSDLKKNFRGDVAEELGIIAGLYNGIKQTVPGLTGIKILIEGREERSFGGHIDISRPIGEEVTYHVQ